MKLMLKHEKAIQINSSAILKTQMHNTVALTKANPNCVNNTSTSTVIFVAMNGKEVKIQLFA